MKFNFLVTLFTVYRVQAYNSNESITLNIVDYFKSATELTKKLLHLNDRLPHDSSFLEFKMGFFDAAFKFQPRQSTTCFTDGLSYLKGTKETLIDTI